MFSNYYITLLLLVFVFFMFSFYSLFFFFFFFLMIRRPPRSTLSSSSAASDVYKRQFQPTSKFATRIAAKISLSAATRIASTSTARKKETMFGCHTPRAGILGGL
eukprot:TRINITY_DN278_c0_g1_i2.p1 TRINITY_DN278_c0_g1~~TRINITY_DN278_c0_g1_i2.p1  ORF type:complete len:105 (+),score=33.82 TRINITY_DN278_c0_g1_i2:1-315(+)